MLKSLVSYLLVNAGALYVTTLLLGGDFILTGGWKGYLIAAFIFGILNGLVKPLVKLLAFPFVLLTAGLFTLVINMALVWLAAYALRVLAFNGVALSVNGGWTTYLYAGFLIAAINVVLGWVRK